jgi:hypothetical protein
MPKRVDKVEDGYSDKTEMEARRRERREVSE